MGAKDKALADFATAITTNPDAINLVREAALLRWEHGDKDIALTMVDERISRGGKAKGEMQAVRATLLGWGGDRDGAVALMDQAVAASPGNASLLNQRCWTKATLSVSLDTALKDCTRALELTDEPAVALDSRAMVYFRQERFPEALADLDAALESAPDTPSSLYLRSVILARTGKEAEGRVEAAVARSLSPRIDEEYAHYGINAP